MLFNNIKVILYERTTISCDHKYERTKPRGICWLFLLWTFFYESTGASYAPIFPFAIGTLFVFVCFILPASINLQYYTWESMAPVLIKDLLFYSLSNWEERKTNIGASMQIQCTVNTIYATYMSVSDNTSVVHDSNK